MNKEQFDIFFDRFSSEAKHACFCIMYDLVKATLNNKFYITPNWGGVDFNYTSHNNIDLSCAIHVLDPVNAKAVTSFVASIINELKQDAEFAGKEKLDELNARFLSRVCDEYHVKRAFTTYARPIVESAAAELAKKHSSIIKKHIEIKSEKK